MINLLPPSYRQTLKSHRQDSIAKRWLIIIWLSTVGLVIVIAGGWFYINQQTKSINDNIASDKDELSAQHLDQVQKDAKTLTGNITTINQVLGREVRFSELIQDIGKAMPPGTVLTSLSLSQISGGLDLSASSVDHPSAAQVAVNLSDPGKNLFTKVDIVSISCNPVQSGTSAYPCDSSYRVLFSKSAQSRYIGVAKTGQ